jgi:predicted TIM-barrel fold metal-dependent hydrolase
MKIDDMVLISVDDHLIEPPDCYSRHISAKYKDQAPRMVRKGGFDRWLIEDQEVGAIGLNAVAGRPRDEYGMEPLSHDQMRAGCVDIHKRIDDMNANGLLGSINFPTLGGFAGVLFSKLNDKNLGLAIIQAYNDWHVHDWAGPYPGRMIPLGMLPLWDAQLCAQEIARLAKLGVHAVTFPDNPAAQGFPSIHDPFWDPVWKVCADNKVVLCCHIGTGGGAAHASADSPIEAWITTMPMSISNSAADWIYAPMWEKYPDLRMALSEGGIGWVPYLLERAEYTHEHHHAWTHFKFGSKAKSPREVFRKHIMTCFIDDAFGLKNLDEVGEDMVTWECDYPHSDTTWPDSPEYLWKTLNAANLTDAQIEKVTHSNAMREYSFDAFGIHGGRENCTVAALRAKAEHVDTKPVANLGGAKASVGADGVSRSGAINEMYEETQ